MLDASVAELLFGSLAGTGDFVQSGDSLAAGTASGEAPNTAPTNVELFLGESEIFENDVLQLMVTFEDTDVEDTHAAIIDWGDGTPLEMILIDQGSHFVGTSHHYLDDNPSASAIDVNMVSVTIVDSSGECASAMAPLTVKNIAPMIDSLTITTPIEEGQFATLTGTFTDPGTQDTYDLDIDWDGDNSFDQTVEVSDGKFQVSRQFLDDNPSRTLTDTFDVNVRLRDDDSGFDSASVQLTVEDVSPFNVKIEPIEMIDENGFATIHVTFEDSGVLDTHFASINWGDGTPVQRVDLEPGERSLTVTHQFLDDDPTGTSSDSYLIRVGIINDDLGRSVPRPTAEVLVKNVAPVLTLANQEVDEGTLLDLTGGGLGTFTDVGTRDTHTATVNWGDGTVSETALVNQGSGTGTLDGSHVYAENGLYTVTVILMDDDRGIVEQQFTVTVNNVAPTPTIVLDPVMDINENGFATLSGRIIDPGSLDTFTLDITWGDPLSPDDMQSFALDTVALGEGDDGINWDPLTRTFSLTHQYLDDNPNNTTSDIYTIDVKVADDDLGLGSSSVTVNVINLDPLIDTLSVLPTSINETETVTLRGTFSDVGTKDFHSIEIRWGDGIRSFEDDPNLIFTQNFSGSGKFEATHTYADNDTENPDDAAKDNIYSIVVIVTDDDGGKHTRVFDLEVLNIDPVLNPIAQVDATDVDTNGETFVTITFTEVGADHLSIYVDWGDIRDEGDPFLRGEKTFVEETPIMIVGPIVPMDSITGAGTYTAMLSHKYDGPPNPLSPAADIEIRVYVIDDDFNFAAAGGQVDGTLEFQPITQPGRSQLRAVSISNSGTGTAPVVIDTTPQVPRLTFPQQEESTFFVGASVGDEGGSQTADLRTAVGDTKSTTDSYLELRVIDPVTGEASEGFRLKPEVLKDLPGLFSTLPDNHYAIYLVRTETNTERLVIEVYVRNGKVIDPGDDSEGTRDRPPTNESTEVTTDEEISEPKLDGPGGREASDPEEDSDDTSGPELEDAAVSDFGKRRLRLLLGSTLVGLAASQAGRSWAERIDQALVMADAKKWRRLRNRQPNNRHKPNKRKED